MKNSALLIRSLLSSIMLAFCSCTVLYSQIQIDVYNRGTLLRIEKDATVTINGDYQDLIGTVAQWNNTTTYNLGNRVLYNTIIYESITNSNLNNQPDTSPVQWVLAFGTNIGASLDAPIFLSGSLQIAGNIVNQSANNTNLIYEFESPSHTGKVVLIGAGDQTIGGTVFSYFPNLEINKPSGSVILQNNITVDNNLTLTSGSVNLNNRTLLLSQNGNIAGETGPNRILGGYPGQLETTTFQLSSVNGNYRGIGLGYPVLATNFVDTKFLRLHGPGNYTVADGANILRVYKMETTTSTGTFPQLTFYYHDSELNGIPETNLALYVSNDNGSTWLKASSSVDAVANIVTASNVAVVSGLNNIFTLAAASCSALNKPVVTISSTNSEVIVGGTLMNICDQRGFGVEVPNVVPNFYQWTLPDLSVNTSSSLSIGSIQFANEGAYQIFARNQKGCDDIATLTVDVRAIPTPSFSITPDPNTTALCFNNQLSFDDTSATSDGTPISGWAWNFGDTNTTTSSIKSPFFTYPTVGQQTPRLIVTSAYGCVSNEITKNIAIETLPTTAFEITNGTVIITETCEDINVVLSNQSTYFDYNNASSALSYQWTFGDGDTSTSDNPTHAFLTSNTYNLTLRATANTQCFTELTKTIQVNPEPIPSFIPRVTGSPISEVCVGVYVLFDNQTTMPGGTGMTFAWDFTDGELSTQVSPSKQFTVPNAYNPILTATSTVFGCKESYTVPITVNPAPEGNITVADADICLDETALFTNNSSILSGSMTYQWDFADATGSTSNLAQVPHSYTQPRLYKALLTRTSNKGCTNAVSRNVTVHPFPVAEFQHLNVCDGKDAEFYNNSVIQSDVIQTFDWDFGDNTSSVASDPKHLFPVYGNYTVVLKATSSFGCVNQITHSVNIYRNPSFNLGASVAGCSGLTILDPAADINAYLPAGSTFSWFDSSGFLGNTPQLQVSDQGIYSVKITTPSPELCESTTAIPLFVFKPVNLGADVVSCAQLVLDAESGLPGEKIKADQTQYQWRKDGSQFSTQQVITVIETGDYEVTVTRTKAGASCSSTDLIHVDIELPLAVSLPAQLIKCEGDLLTLDAGVVAQNYAWTNLNSGAVVGTAKTLAVTISGTYKVQVTNAACTAATTTEVIFSPLPTVSFGTPSLTFCTGEVITLTDYSFTSVGSLASNEWDLGDNTTVTNQPQVLKSYGTAGEYEIILKATTLAGCSNTYNQTLSIKASPVADFNVMVACEQETLIIQNNSSPVDVTFAWHFDDDTESNLVIPVKSFAEDGQHTISLAVTSNTNGCVASLSKNVTVNPLPDVDFGGQINTCGGSILLDGFNPGSTYNWFDPLNGNLPLSTSQQYLVSSDGSIGLEVINSFGCNKTDIATVALNTSIVVDLGSDRSACDLEILDAGYFPGGQYVWSDATTARTLGANSSGIYSVNVTDQNGCVGTSSVVLQVNQTPVLRLGGDQVACDGSLLLLDAGTGSGYTYLWSTGSTASSIAVNNSGNYGVTVSNAQCNISQSVAVTVQPSPIADFAGQNVCSGNSVSFSNASQSAGGALTYLWNLGDGTFSSQTNTSKIYNSSGSYSVSLKARSDKGCENEITKSITIYAVPVAAFSVQSGCTGTELIIGNNTSYTGSSALSYQWDFGNAQSSSAAVPNYAYSTPGVYFANLVVSSAEGCSDNYLQEVTIGQTPSSASWLAEVETCDSSVILDASNPGSAFVWSDNSTAQNLQLSQSGIYAVTVTAPDGCAVDLAAIVIFNNRIQPILDPSIVACGSVVLDPIVQAVTYLWSTGAQTKTIAVSTSNQYSIQVINQDLCIGNASTLVQINPIPVFELGTDRQACDGEVLEISSPIVIPVDYLWSTGSVADKINVTQSGNYSLKATTLNGCSFEDILNIVFHAVPVLDFDPTITACGSLDLDAKNSGSSYQWSTGSTQQVLNVTQSGIYQLEVVNGDNCKNQDVINVTILALPSLDLGPDIVLCNNQTKVLDAGATTNQYLWSDNSTNRYLTVGSAGDYKATITNSLGCSASDMVSVVVRPPLGLDLGNDRLICSNEGIFLDAGVSNASYSWGSDVGFTSNQKTIRPSKPGRYWVSVIDSYTCTAADSIKVTATTQTITASFLIPSIVDKGNVVQFAQLTEPEPITFYWEFGDGGNSREKNPIHRYFTAGEFNPTLTVSNGVCSDTLRKSITVRNARTEGEPINVLPTLLDIVKANLYPNPSSGAVRLSVELTTQAEVIVSLFSLDGHRLDQQQKWLQEDEFEFDISSASEGVYLIQVMVGSRMKVFKLVKTGQ